MKRKINLSLLTFCLLLLASCKDAGEDVNPAGNPEREADSGISEEEIKVNPAHGLPGHRCDLPVGAPLNAASTPNPQPVSQLPATSVSPIRLDQSPDYNPAHGEPGHDCSVPVGAKLEK